MKASGLGLALASALAVEAHTIFTTLWVDGVSQGDGVGIRMRKQPEIAANPIALSDDAMACGYDGQSGNPRVVTVADGVNLGFEWRAWGSDPSKGAIDPGHKGPCSVYLKKVDSAVNDTATGDGWFKIWDEGYDEANDKWCTEKLGGPNSDGAYEHKLSVNLPKGLEPGYYLARPELLALHNAVATPPDPQFYTGCAQIFIKGNGDKKAKDTVSIPGAVTSSDKAVTFNIYDSPLKLPYDTPGPKVAALVSAGASGGSEQTTQAEGLEPAGCILEMAGWCAYEVASYTDETGCYASGQKCWDQVDACWTYAKQLPTTGSPWCNLLNDKCQAIDDECNAKNYDGPPNKGKVLTPSNPTASVPAVAATSNYESGSGATSAATSAAAVVKDAAVVVSSAAADADALPTTLATSFVLAASASSSKATATVAEASAAATHTSAVTSAAAAAAAVSSAPAYGNGFHGHAYKHQHQHNNNNNDNDSDNAGVAQVHTVWQTRYETRVATVTV